MQLADCCESVYESNIHTGDGNERDVNSHPGQVSDPRDTQSWNGLRTVRFLRGRVRASEYLTVWLRFIEAYFIKNHNCVTFGNRALFGLINSRAQAFTGFGLMQYGPSIDPGPNFPIHGVLRRRNSYLGLVSCLPWLCQRLTST